jgi:hypothetical protein
MVTYGLRVIHLTICYDRMWLFINNSSENSYDTDLNSYYENILTNSMRG